MRGDAISLLGSTLVRIWVVFPVQRTNVPYSQELGRFERPIAVIDNDGSAEILIVSLSGQPALQVLRDADDRWIQARRIWNQHAYYVTNVREDSTIPQQPVDNWKHFNTFRTNAQIEGGALCMPPIPQ